MKSVRLLRVSWLESSKTKQNNLSSTFATVTSVLAGTVISIYQGEAVPRLGGDEAGLSWLCFRVPALFLSAPQGPAESQQRACRAPTAVKTSAPAHAATPRPPGERHALAPPLAWSGSPRESRPERLWAAAGRPAPGVSPRRTRRPWRWRRLRGLRRQWRRAVLCAPRAAAPAAR